MGVKYLRPKPLILGGLITDHIKVDRVIKPYDSEYELHQMAILCLGGNGTQNNIDGYAVYEGERITLHGKTYDHKPEKPTSRCFFSNQVLTIEEIKAKYYSHTGKYNLPERGQFPSPSDNENDIKKLAECLELTVKEADSIAHQIGGREVFVKLRSGVWAGLRKTDNAFSLKTNSYICQNGRKCVPQGGPRSRLEAGV